jgi:hypothetical protein
MDDSIAPPPRPHQTTIAAGVPRSPAEVAALRLRRHFPGVYQIGDVYPRSCSVIVVPGSGVLPKRFAS